MNYSTISFLLTEKEFNYLLPALRKQVKDMDGRYVFIGSFDELEDMLSRLKGLYGNFDEKFPNSTIVYKCLKDKSIEPFRKAVKEQNHPLKENYERFFGPLK
jgi:hypothetical protein